MELDDITGKIVETSILIHKRLGPGVFESAYETILGAVLQRRGLRVARQVPISIDFDGIHIEQGYRIDLLVERAVIVEVKSLDRMAPIHRQQLLTYLRLADLRLGLLLNFGAPLMIDGITRVVNDH